MCHNVTGFDPMGAAPSFPAPSREQPSQRLLQEQARWVAQLAQKLQVVDTDALNTSAATKYAAADALETSMAAITATTGRAVDTTAAAAAKLIEHLSSYGDQIKIAARLRGKQGQKALKELSEDLEIAVDLGKSMSNVYAHNHGIPWTSLVAQLAPTAHGFLEGMSSYEAPNTQLPYHLPVLDPQFSPKFARVFPPILRVFDVDLEESEFYVDIMDQMGVGLDDVDLDEVRVIDFVRSDELARAFVVQPHWANVHPFFDNVPCAPGRLRVNYSRGTAWPGGVCVQYLGSEVCIPLFETLHFVGPVQQRARRADPSSQLRALGELQKPYERDAVGSPRFMVYLKLLHNSGYSKSVPVFAANTTQAMLRQAGLPETYRIIRRGQVLKNPINTNDLQPYEYLHVFPASST